MFNLKNKKDKVVMIEKEVEVEVKVPVLKNSCITVISNASTGKSFISWVLSHCFSDKGYNTTLINLDRGYSANSFFGIDEDIARSLEDIENIKDFKQILEKAFLVDPNLRVVTSKICSDYEINKDDMLKLISTSSASSDITIIDSKTKTDEILKVNVTYSNIIIMVFDLDYMHYKLNLKMLEGLKEYLNLDKTIAVINNTFECVEINNMKKFINLLGFRDVITIRNEGVSTYESIHTHTCPYFTTKSEEFKDDIDNLMLTLSSNDNNKQKNFLNKLFR